MKRLFSASFAVSLALFASASGAAGLSEFDLRCTASSAVTDITSGARFAPEVVSAPRSKLPPLMVDGWKAQSLPLDAALRDLLADSGVKLVIEGKWKAVSWSGASASLTSVVDSIIKQGGGDWRYDGKVLTVVPRSEKAERFLAVPGNRDVSLAMLDSLRGYGATDVKLSADRIAFSADDALFAKIQKRFAGVSSLVALDIFSLKARPEDGRFSWQDLAKAGATISSLPEEAGGLFVIRGANSEKIRSFFAWNGDVVDRGFQTIAGPDGWTLDVPAGQCAPDRQVSRSILIKSQKSGSEIALTISAAAKGKDLATKVQAGDIVILADPTPSKGWIDVSLIRVREIKP